MDDRSVAVDISRVVPSGSSADGAAVLSINQDAHLALEAFAHRRGRHVGHFNVPVYALIHGPLAIGALEDAINVVIGRHTILRTEFPDVSSLPANRERAVLEKLVAADGWKRAVFSGVVHNNVGIALTVRPTHHAGMDIETSADRHFIETALVAPFKYSNCPLMRATLFQESSTRHALLLVFHHLVADAWSLRLFVNELCEVYGGFADGAPPRRIPEPAVQYADFAAWQRRVVGDASPTGRLHVWQDRYRRSAPHGITFDDLPFLRRVSVADSDGTALQTIRLGMPLSERMRGFSRQAGLTLYALCLSALYALCHLHCRRGEVAIWGAVANRVAGTERLIGWLSEGRLLGMPVDGDVPFSTFVKNVRSAVLETIAEQYVPLSALQHPFYRHPHPALHGADAVHVTLDITDPNGRGLLRLGDGVSLVPSRVLYNRTTAPNIVRLAVEASEDIAVSCYYDARTVSATGIQLLLQQFRAVMAQCLDDPARRLRACELAQAVTPSV